MGKESLGAAQSFAYSCLNLTRSKSGKNTWNNTGHSCSCLCIFWSFCLGPASENIKSVKLIKPSTAAFALYFYTSGHFVWWTFLVLDWTLDFRTVLILCASKIPQRFDPNSRDSIMKLLQISHPAT